MNKKFSVPRGTADILPDDIASWQFIEATARNVLTVYGYKQIITPLFEETELFARSMGQTSDVVQKQMLTLQSQRQEGESAGLALRPEGTAAVVRSYIENSFDRKETLSKLFYIGPMFRGERPQKGRLRQFHQIGVEAIGPESASPYLDAEVIRLSVELLTQAGLQPADFKLKINTLGSNDDKTNFAKFLREHLQPARSGLCEDCQDRFERNVFRVLDCKNKSCQALVAKLDLNHAYLSADSRKYFADVCLALDSLGIKYEKSLTLVRGLDYYTHTVFEISSSALGSQDALGAGGRYNNLVSQLGGPAVDAIGFALGVERILLALVDHPKPASRPLKVFIVTLDEASLRRGFQILHILRRHHIAGDMSYRLSSMKSQMRQADKSGAEFVMIIGEEEYKKGAVTLKQMSSGKQQELKAAESERDCRALIELLCQETGSQT